MVSVRVRYFAGAKAAAGVAEESIEVAAGSTAADVLELLRTRHGEDLSRVLTACSFLVDGVALRAPDQRFIDSVELDVLPPFAGG
jgi:sulfur-carrier protein